LRILLLRLSCPIGGSFLSSSNPILSMERTKGAADLYFNNSRDDLILGGVLLKPTEVRQSEI